MALFTIKNIITEDEMRIKNKIRDDGAYDWTRKRNVGEEDYSLSMPKVIEGLSKGLTRVEIAKLLTKRVGQIKYIEDLLTARHEHPTLSKKVQATRNIERQMRVMSKWKSLNKDPKNFTSHDFNKLKNAVAECEQQARIKEGKVA